MPFPIGTPVRHASWGAGVVECATVDSLTIHFDAVGFKTFDLALVQERGVVERDGSEIPVVGASVVAVV